MHNFIYYVHKKGESMKKIAILASGEGTNAERIIRYFRHGDDNRCRNKRRAIIGKQGGNGSTEQDNPGKQQATTTITPA